MTRNIEGGLKDDLDSILFSLLPSLSDDFKEISPPKRIEEYLLFKSASQNEGK